MAKQLNILSQGKVIATPLHTEMQQSYLEYAMSVIVGRALPDVRDGLKPVHRRILYAMHELGLTPDRQFRKCARVVGDVLGKYHPHGDQAVYDALVRLVQDFSSRYPLLAGHGNFGSVDNDPPAAMRYTETRLASLSHEALLSEIGDSTVDFMGNFDNSQQEPVVLPAQLPILLLNGSSGIAVGMATNIPPHNLAEVVDALIALSDNPDLPTERLLKFIPGPDFPTGGEVIGAQGIQDAYTTGRGSITVRGIAQVEEIQPGRGRQRRHAIIVTELPYQVNKSAWIEKMADLTNQGRLEGISDLRDESDRDGMRVVIELKREAQPQVVLENLYRQTTLQTNFGTIMLALVNGQPQQMSLRELLQHFLNFREQTLTRRYSHHLNQAESRLHIVEGLRLALTHLDQVITILRGAPDGTTAKVALQAQFNLSDRQADSILAMPLRRLTGLEQQNLQSEFTELTHQILELQKLLGNRHELLKALKRELRALKRKHSDPRRTRIQPEGHLSVAAPEEDQTTAQATVEITHRGYVRRRKDTPTQLNGRPKRTKPDQAMGADARSLVTNTYLTQLAADLLVFTGSGKAYGVKVQDIPLQTGRERGVPLVTLLPSQPEGQPERNVAQFAPANYPETVHVVLLTHQGRIKRVPLSEFALLTGRGLVALRLKAGDQLLCASLVEVTTAEIVIATSAGRLLRFRVTELPVMSRASMGEPALRLHKQEHLVGFVTLQAEGNLLLVSQQGYGKRIPLNVIRLGHRGDIGTHALQLSRTDALAAIAPTPLTAEVTLFTDTNRAVGLAVDTIPLWGKEGPGSRLLKVNRGETVTGVTTTATANLENSE